MTKITPLNLPLPQPYFKKKWVTLSKDNLSLMTLFDADLEMLSDVKINDNSRNYFRVGEVYSIGSESVEGVEFEKSYFIVCGVVDEYKGCKINSLILREVTIDEEGKISDCVNHCGRKKFSIPPSMCKQFGIKYMPGFELWPMNSGFKHVDLNKLNIKDINYANMSTYPTSKIDGTIRKILLELHGFSSYNASHIITPTGAMIPTDDFISSLTIFARQNISTDNGCAGFRIGDKFPFKIVSRKKGDEWSSICDEKHNIYVKVYLSQKSLNAATSDGKIGIAQTALEGKDIDDIIGVKWDESSDENNINQQGTFNNTTAEFDKIFNGVNVEIDKVIKALNRHFGPFSPLQI